ncbi:MAG: ferrous iron transport protein A [Clostridia bacterium]|nr:ferrous iron transport protein A [Clostridia bacterium]
MKLSMAQEGKEYKILSIDTNDEELNSFLFTLGCYQGEPITDIKQRKSGSIIVIKDGRYSIDRRLSDAITVTE